jgi:hypothetical protein
MHHWLAEPRKPIQPTLSGFQKGPLFYHCGARNYVSILLCSVRQPLTLDIALLPHGFRVGFLAGDRVYTQTDIIKLIGGFQCAFSKHI